MVSVTDRGSAHDYERNDSDGRKLSWKEAYEVTDVGEWYLFDRFSMTNVTPERYGMNNRHEDIPSADIDGNPDLRLRDDDDGETLGYVEIKTKQNEDWMYVTNQYQWDTYVDHADDHDEPTYIGWLHMDTDSDVEALTYDSEWHYPIETHVVYESRFVEVTEYSQVKRSWTAPDGNTVVKIDESEAIGFETLLKEVQ